MDKTCNTTAAFAVALDLLSIKVKEKPEAHSVDADTLVKILKILA